MHCPDYGKTERKECAELNNQVTQVPSLEFELARLNAAETDKEHQEQQDGLGLAADKFKCGPGGMDGGYLHVDKVRSGTGDHAYYQHPVLEKFKKSAFHFAVLGFSGCEYTFYLRFPF
jgi:hypothetical protein